MTDKTMTLDPSDLVIEVWPQSNGGMKVGVPCGVRVTHKPTGASVTCEHERSGHANRDAALRGIQAAITRHLSQPAERVQEKAEPVAWQYRRNEDGMWGMWQDVDSKHLPVLRTKPDIETRALYTAPPAERVRVPEGWKLVPIEPTHEMCSAPDAVWHPEARKIWMQMLFAAPEATPSPTIDVAAVTKEARK